MDNLWTSQLMDYECMKSYSESLGNASFCQTSDIVIYAAWCH